MDFTDIAYAKFLQTVPELGNMIVAFNDCSEELEGDEVHVGVFILKAGEDFFFIPVIAKGESVFPIDSIFFNSKSKFFPLTKSTIELVTNSQQLAIGKPSKIPGTFPKNPSVHDLVTPPRTGKFNYASGSRLIEFLAAMTKEAKQFALEKISSDEEVYNGLHRMFGLPDVYAALKTVFPEKADAALDVPSGVKIITDGENLTTEQINTILTKGYHVHGAHALGRIAIPTELYKNKTFSQLSAVDSGSDYNVVFKTAEIIPGFFPLKAIPLNTSPFNEYNRNTDSHELVSKNFVLFENGDYAFTGTMVVSGEKSAEKNVLKTLLGIRPPVLIKNLMDTEKFAIFTPDFRLVGVFSLRKMSYTHQGAHVKVWDDLQGKSLTINAIRGYGKTPVYIGDELFVPFEFPVVVLGSNRSDDVESSVNTALTRAEALNFAHLNETLNLTYDDVEFSVNGRPIGGEPDVIRVLVMNEGLAPEAANTFIKKAKEDKRVSLLMSKKADFEPGEIPQFGTTPPKQPDYWGMNSSAFLSNSQKAVKTGDSQTVEATIISELLQEPNMFELVTEYLPDIEEAIDRLGRVLFLGRVNISKLGEETDADDVFSFLTQLKNVYKQLGDNYVKLMRLSANADRL